MVFELTSSLASIVIVCCAWTLIASNKPINNMKYFSFKKLNKMESIRSLDLNYIFYRSYLKYQALHLHDLPSGLSQDPLD